MSRKRAANLRPPCAARDPCRTGLGRGLLLAAEAVRPAAPDPRLLRRPAGALLGGLRSTSGSTSARRTARRSTRSTAGIAHVHADNLAIVSDAETFGYWHVRPEVAQGSTVQAHQRIGTVIPPWAHVHFAESIGGIYVNPLRPARLAPYVDTTSPTIAGIEVQSHGKRMLAQHVTGTVGPRRDGVRHAAGAAPARALVALAGHACAAQVAAPPRLVGRAAVAHRRRLPQHAALAGVLRHDLRARHEAEPREPPRPLPLLAVARHWDTRALPDGSYRRRGRRVRHAGQQRASARRSIAPREPHASAHAVER